MIIIGGLKYVTSAGDSNSITSAKNTILYAIIGIIIAASAQFLVQFVLRRTDASPDPAPATPPAANCDIGEPCPR
jgi:hypothetical protein